MRCDISRYADYGGMTEETLPAGFMPSLPPDADLGPKMLACLPSERKFVWAYVINGGNGSAAARAAGYSAVSGGDRVRAHELIHRDRVLEALHEVAWKSLRGLSLLATLRAKQVLDNEKHPELIRMIGMVWSRTGFAEKTIHENRTTVEVSHTDEALEALTYLKSMQVPREKLVEQFGHSGLARYEKMLEERDRKMKVIEHEPDGHK